MRRWNSRPSWAIAIVSRDGKPCRVLASELLKELDEDDQNVARLTRATEEDAMTTERMIKDMKKLLLEAHGRRLRGIVLYGSQARGESGPESDIDVLVLLDEPIKYGRDLDINIKALYPLSVELSRRISAKPVSARLYETADCPLYRNARREGTAA